MSLEWFLASTTSGDRHFAEDYDVGSATSLVGADRVAAIDRLIECLDQGDDPRAPRCLAAMNARECGVELRIAATTAHPGTRAEAATAVWHLAGDSGFAISVLEQVLHDPRASTWERGRAVMGLEQIGGDAAREALISGLDDADPAIAGMAWDGIRKILGVFGVSGPNSRIASLETLLTLAPLPVRIAMQAPMRTFIQDVLAGRLDRWTPDARLADPEVDRVRMWMRPTATEAPFPAGALPSLTDADRERLQAWAAMHVRNGNPRGITAMVALETPGAHEALHALLPTATPDFAAAIHAALATL